MSKLLAVAVVAALVAVVAAAPQVTRKDELEYALFLKGGKAIEPKELVSMVDELSEIYANTDFLNTHEDRYFRRWTSVLKKMSRPSKAQCMDLYFLSEFAFECLQNSYMKEATAAFHQLAQQQFNELCKQLFASQKVTRKDELEAAIFLKGGAAIEPQELISMVDELSNIYGMTVASNTYEDMYYRKWTEVLSKMSHPSKANCADLSYLKDFAAECQQNSYLRESTAALFQVAEKQQEQMC